ncbi:MULTISPECIES: WG repeat-containing protein [unclassified Bacillus (in: firmicutes)]|uniref:WG repeat-containing protein n=1 Tax=unclassified Bacillus (in: firmicutes) TaxID=185979 RepID=UPI0008EC2461|nr:MULTISPECIES: WG repeat-containing protein [unclassified Bacillus (in: firmicutes)]SFB08156.1 WG containing repeat-containing protein [Bacillus sp. UNCCL13]SFQ87143.1 WG containing repeat-containing protein [Bacillus sp. cl95]
MYDKENMIDRIKNLLPIGAKLYLTDLYLDKKYEVSKSLYSDKYGVYTIEDKYYLFVLQGTETDFSLRVIAELEELSEFEKIRKGNILHRASVRKVGGTKWGFINNKGDFILPPIYDGAQNFQENGLAVVELMNEAGLINGKGYFIVKPKYDTINPFFEGRATVITSKGFKVIDESGKETTESVYSFIGDFHDGRAVFANTNAEGKYLYGYLNRQGREVIPLQFETAYDFKNQKALVKRQDGKYALIGLTGKELAVYDYEYVGNLGDGLLAFQKKAGEKFGYMDEQGMVVIQPQFTGAQPFSKGRAVVNTAEDYQNMYGLINREGKFVFHPKYNEIDNLGEGRYSIGKARDAEKPYMGSTYALGDDKGHMLTGFLFNRIYDFKNGVASVFNDQYTFFIDRSGKRNERLPMVSGSGILEIQGYLIEGNIDYRLYYFDKNGSVVWKQNTVIELNNQYSVHERKFKPNRDYLVYYPQIEGYSDKDIQVKVNRKLADMSGVKKIDENAQLESNYVGDFEVPFYKNILVQLKLSAYNYPFGAAHGMPTKIYAHINLKTGTFYQLKDLFKPGSDYVKVLSDIIALQIKYDEQYSYVFPDTYKGISADQPYFITENDLNIYFAPYEIAPYAAGFPTFKIPFTRIMDIIDTQSSFWRAFH